LGVATDIGNRYQYVADSVPVWARHQNTLT
jgi:hypothetical protein